MVPEPREAASSGGEPSPVRGGRRARLLALAAILAAAGGLRLVGLDWDQGQHLHPDERFLTMVESSIAFPRTLAEYFDTAASPLNPANHRFGFFVYGTFPLFLVRAVAGALDRADYDHVHIVGRVLAACFDLGTVALTWRLGALVAGPIAALAAAALMATSVLSIQQAHFFTVDSFGAFFALAALVALLHVARGGRSAWQVAFGFAFGLALACRVNLLLVGALYPIALVSAWRRGGIRGTHAAAGALAAGVVTALVFRVFQPYAFAGPGFFDLRPAPEFLSSMRQIRGFVTGDVDYPPGVQWIGRTPILFAAKNLYVWGLGPAWGVAALAGTAWLLFRRHASGGARPILGRIAALGAAAVFLYQGAQFAATGRYFLPVLPIFAVAASAWLLEARPRAGRPALALVLVLTAAWAVAFTAIYRRPHSRVAASRWIYDHVAPGSTIANEHWDDGLPLSVDGRSPQIYRGIQMPLYDDDTAAKRRTLVDDLDAADVVVLSSNRLYRSIPRAPWRYPLARRYYELLFAGELGFRLERVFTSYPRLGPIEIPDDAAEEAFTVYDHPKVLVFRKTPEFSRARLEALLEAVPLGRTVHVAPREASALYRRVRPSEIALPGEEAVRTAVGAGTATSAGALVRWLAALEALSVAAFALVFRPLAGARDRGFGVAKILAWLGLGYGTWLAASFGLAASTAAAARALGVALALGGGAALWSSRAEIGAFVRREWRALAAGEAAFLAVFAFFLGTRLFHPAIYWGEKPMDFAILNAITRSTTMPPVDPWFAGSRLNYFYFGHALVAFFAELAGVPPPFAFNLAIPTVAGLLALAALLVGREVGGRTAAGVLAALGVVVFGNLAGLRLFTGAHAGAALDFNYFWATSRVIEGTINEFPFWTMLFADLHAHVLALPFDLVLVYLGCLWPAAAAGRVSRLFLATTVAWVLGAVGATSSWSVPVAAALQLGLLATAWRGRRRTLLGVMGILVVWLAVLALSRFLFAPFWASYRPPPRQWGFEHEVAPLADVVTIFGLFFVALVPALLRHAVERPLSGALGVAVAGAAAAGACWLRSPAAGLFAALAAFAVVLWWSEERSGDLRIAALLVAAAGAIGVGTETFFVWDRMNTVFKYYLQMWMLFACAAALALPPTFAAIGRRARIAAAGLLLLVVGSSLFTSVTDTIAFLRSPHAPSPVPTLDGTAYLELARPGERRAFEWLNREVPGVPVLLEAQGPPYQDFSRVSMNTGLPTVLGWEYHLFQQSHGWAEIDRRREDVKTLYETTDRSVAAELMRRYRVDLVYVGPLERRTYAPAGLAKFAGWPAVEPVFRSRDVTIYSTPGVLHAAKTWIDEVDEAGRPLAAPGLLREPRDVARAPDGTLWVADFGNRRIEHFTAERRAAGGFGREGDEPGQFRDPCGVAVAGDGSIYVADTWNHRVQRFTSRGEYAAEWGGGFYGPRGIASGPDGSVYVADSGNHRVVRFTADGRRLGEWGKAAGPARLQSPIGVAVDGRGEVYVADVGNRRVAVFSPEGVLLRAWPVEGWQPRALLEPYLEVGPDGVVWVTDPSGNRVLLYQGDGRPLGIAVPSRPLATPLGIAVVDADHAVVSNAATNDLVLVSREGLPAALSPAPDRPTFPPR